MKRFHMIVPAIAVSVLFAGCTSSTQAEEAPSKRNYEAEASSSVTMDLKQKGFDVVSVGPFAHERPTKDSLVMAAFVKVKSNCGTDILMATNAGNTWVVTHEDGTAVSADDMQDQRCGG